MFGIIGSGFGLYGHLPVIALSGGRINLPERYKGVINQRQELMGFLPQITWCRDEEEVLERSEQVAISTWPMGQEMYIQRSLQIPSIRSLLLEKPLAVTPQRSAGLLEVLKRSEKNFRINYAFLQTPWFRALRSLKEQYKIESIRITWHFMAHHYKQNLDNWKRKEAEGGGAIRFFGIHFFAVLCALGFNTVTSSATAGQSTDDKRSWKAVFSDVNNMTALLEVNAGSTKRWFDLDVTYRNAHNEEHQFQLKLEEPFAETSSKNGQDPRVSGLSLLYKELSLQGNDESPYKLYEAVNTLWAEAELKNKHKILPPDSIN